MVNATVQTAVCKSLQSIGLSPRKEHQIENAIAIQIRSSGPEFLLGRLSDLTDWRKMHMKGDTSYHPEWHAYKSRKGKNTPADPIGSQLWGLSDKAFFAAVGALKKSVELAVPTEKQLSKWLEGVRCENKSDAKCHLGFRAGRGLCIDLEEQLERKWANREWFNVTDVSGTNIPGSGKFMTVKVDKATCQKEPLSLLSAYGFSVSTAPLFVWQFLKDIDAPTRMGEGVDCPEELVDSLSQIIDAKLNSYQLQDEALMGSSFMDDEHYLATRAYKNANLGFEHSVGNIGFLEQPGGKLRTVANPNRLVQYVNRPLGEVLSEAFYRQDGYYVMNQDEGMKWAQEKLRQGISLSSFDMSSATDRLDYRKFLHEYFSVVYAEPDQFRLLSRSLDLFEDTSVSNWTIPGHIADLCGMTGNEIGWTVGQPLGLRPSFPILSIMNASFAKSAIRAVDGKFSPGHFACVGDDLIIETRYAQAYMDKVTGFNGKINNDKTMESDRYAEFCSHLITKSTCYPLKPRFISELDGSLQNVEKFTTSGLHPKVPTWVKDLHDLQARYYLEGFNTIKFSNSTSPATLMERIGVNTLIEAIKPATRDQEKVTLQTLYMRAEQERVRLGAMPQAKELSTSYASSAYPKFGGNEAKPNVKVKYEAVDTQSEYGTLGAISTDQSTSVELPIKKEWDFRKASYSRPTSELNQAKQVAKTLGKIETYTVGPLVESKTVVKGVETTILVDMSSDTPEISLSHRPRTANGTAEAQTNAKPAERSPQVQVESKAQQRLAALKAKLDAKWLDDGERSDDDEYDR
jgi:hypothetical protein